MSFFLYFVEFIMMLVVIVIIINLWMEMFVKVFENRIYKDVIF